MPFRKWRSLKSQTLTLNDIYNFYSILKSPLVSRGPGSQETKLIKKYENFVRVLKFLQFNLIFEPCRELIAEHQCVGTSRASVLIERDNWKICAHIFLLFPLFWAHGKISGAISKMALKSVAEQSILGRAQISVWIPLNF